MEEEEASGGWADSRLVTNGIKGKQNRESVY